MSEFEQNANQSAETEINETPLEQPQTQTQEPPATTQEPNYFTVKYNKEDRQVSYDEAPDYIQKGMNYDKVNQRATEYEQHLNRVAQLSGYQNHDEFIQALSEAEKAQERQRYEEAGINPDTFNQLLENHPDMQYAREMRAREQEQKQYQTEIGELLQHFPDLKREDITDDVTTLRDQHNLSFLDAYLRVNYKNLAQQKEQEAIQKLQNNASSTPGSLGAGAVHQTGYSNLSATDKKALRERVLRGETIEL